MGQEPLKKALMSRADGSLGTLIASMGVMMTDREGIARKDQRWLSLTELLVSQGFPVTEDTMKAWHHGALIACENAT